MKNYKRKCVYLCILILFLIILIIKKGLHKQDKILDHRMQWYLDILFEGRNNLELIGDRRIKIAIIDSGVNNDHLDFLKTDITNYYVSEINGENSDYDHGTMVCGIIAAYPHDSNGILGINPNAEIISIDVSDNQGIVSIEGMIEAIDYAISQNVDIINISIMTQNNYDEFHQAIKRAYDNGIIIIAASGNDIDESCGYPAQYEEVISVGAFSKKGDILYSKLDNTVYLPGENITTTSSSVSEISSYTSKTGTSLATPILTGIISLILSHKQVNNCDIIEYFKKYYGNKITNVNEILKDFDIGY